MQIKSTKILLGAIGLILLTASATHLVAQGQKPTTNMKKEPTMKAQDVFILITTDKMSECRDFYHRHFGFETTFETTIYLQMALPAEKGHSFSLAFMPPDHPFGFPGPEKYNGTGILLTIQVADAKALYEKLKSEGAPILHPLTDEAWGQRRFDTRDPAGVTIDVVQTIEPVAGYYDRYQVKSNSVH